MEKYIESLLETPNKKNLGRIEKEIERTHDIINHYEYIINERIRNEWIPEDSYSFEKMNKIVEKEKEFLNKCHEIRLKIEKILDNK